MSIESQLTHEQCHCGTKAIDKNSQHWPYRSGMCEHCASVRCDAYPGSCEGNYLGDLDTEGSQ